MPHCTLEYSANLGDFPDVAGLLKEINLYLAGTGLFNLGDIKSRALKHDRYAVGDSGPDKAFVSLTIGILSGRNDETKTRITTGALELLERRLRGSMKALTCSVTVQVTDIHRESYQRDTYF